MGEDIEEDGGWWWRWWWEGAGGTGWPEHGCWRSLKIKTSVFRPLIACFSVFSRGFVVSGTLTRSPLNSCDFLFDYLIESLEIMREEHHTAALFFASQNS